MKSDIRFMNEVFRIVSGALRLDVDKVRNYTTFLAQKLEESGDIATAERLRKLLKESDHTLRPAGVSLAHPPVDNESRFPLLERVSPAQSVDQESPLVLSPALSNTVAEFLSVVRSTAQFDAPGIATAYNMLLYGPPGCGKSRLARHIAYELGLDLYIARLVGLISSYLGSTSKNIRAVFEFASKTPCVLFLDEFDAIAKLRGDQQEVGELKRVVNTFLQSLDALSPQTVVIAATNHEELLDRAVWRRFTYHLHLTYPGPEERAAHWEHALKGIGFMAKEREVLVDLSEGLSASDIYNIAQRLHRRRHTTGTPGTLGHALQGLITIGGTDRIGKPFITSLVGHSNSRMAEILRRRSKKLYSYAILARLFGMSKATAYRLTEEVTHG